MIAKSKRQTRQPESSGIRADDSENEEMALLGSMIGLGLRAELEAVSVIVSPSDFSRPEFGKMFAMIQNMAENGEPFSEAIAIRTRLIDDNLFEAIGGASGLTEIFKAVSANPRHYAKRIKLAATRRLADGILAACRAQLADPRTNPNEAIQAVIRSLEVVDVIAEVRPKSFTGIDAGDLEQYQSVEPDWLVEGIFSADQPTVFGAASKATKTTQLTDLAVSLATGEPWLGEFRIPRRRKVLFITGESNYRACAKRVTRALRSRGMTLANVKGWLRIEAVEFPQLPDVRHQMQIAENVKEKEIEVVIIDPLYRGLAGLDTHRMAEMGAAIVEFAKAVQPASLIMSHHVTKSSARDMTGPPSLEDLSGAGLAESCGNWWLLGRNEPYKFDRMHDLVVQYGGRDEQAGIKRILFNEANWMFEISSGQDLKAVREKEREDRREQERQAKLNEAKAKVKNIIANEKQPRPKSWIEDRAGLPQGQVRSAIGELLNIGALREQSYLDAKNREQTGLVLA